MRSAGRILLIQARVREEFRRQQTRMKSLSGWRNSVGAAGGGAAPLLIQHGEPGGEIQYKSGEYAEIQCGGGGECADWGAPRFGNSAQPFLRAGTLGGGRGCTIRYSLLLNRDAAIDLSRPGGEYRQLQLRHPPLLPSLPSAPQIYFRLLLFSSLSSNSLGDMRRSDTTALRICQFLRQLRTAWQWFAWAGRAVAHYPGKIKTRTADRIDGPIHPSHRR